MPAKRVSTEEFVSRARKVHGDRYEYPAPYVGAKEKIEIVCKVHGSFFQVPGNHFYGGGCPKCQRENSRTSQEEFIRRATEVHKGLYGYDEVIYCGTEVKVKIRCSKHGIFEQRPHGHLMGEGCMDCANDQRSVDYRKGFSKFVEEAIVVHLGKYRYPDDNYTNDRTKIKIECPEHGNFFQRPNHHLRGHGCPKCPLGKSVSRSEQFWLDTLNVPQEYRQADFKIGDKRFKVDAFDPTTNTVYEFYGDFFHGNPEKFQPDEINTLNKRTFGDLYQATVERERLLKQANYNLITIWEADWKKSRKGWRKIQKPKQEKGTK